MAVKRKAAKKSTKKSVRKRSTRAQGGAVASTGIDRQFQAESDARTLAEAEAIRQNRGRLSRANREIRKQRDALDDALKPAG